MMEDKFQLTSDEISSMNKAFESSDFRKMMSEYVEEISDPKFRAEQDAYIRQLEAQNRDSTQNIVEGGIPAGKIIIRPSKQNGFVVKFRYRNMNNKPKPCGKNKLFVNVVSSDNIHEPKNDNTNKTNTDEAAHNKGERRTTNGELC